MLARVTVLNFTVKLTEISSSLWGEATRKWRGRSKVRNIFAFTRNLIAQPLLGHGLLRASIMGAQQCCLGAIRVPFASISGPTRKAAEQRTGG